MPGFEYLQALPRERTYLLPALHLVHEHEGFLSPEGLTAVSKHLRVPDSELYGIALSYNEFRLEPAAAIPVEVCTGLSCLLSGAAALKAGLTAALDGRGCEVRDSHCRFLCNLAPVVAVNGVYVAPADGQSVAAAAARTAGSPATVTRPVLEPRPPEVRRLTARFGLIPPGPIEEAMRAGSYEALKAARRLTAAELTARVLASGLRGRGGAYFPAGRKWETALVGPPPRYLVVNAEEGEPGVFKDRYLLEYDPHLVLEGSLIAAHAIEAAHVFFYVNGEARAAAERLQEAIAQADATGFCLAASEAAQGTPSRPVVEVRRGAGGYVCGEESVILSSIEGERAVPRLRPPLPVERGLWGRPTVINNAETLANLPFILTAGVEAFRSVGVEGHPGTKLISLSGAVRRPGLYEVPLGTSLRQVLFDLGDGPREGRALRAALCGGPSGGLMPASLFDTPLIGGSLDPGGAALGAGGIVAIDDSMRIADVVHHLAAYNAAESCGKCTPCREGAPRMRDLLAELRDGTAAAGAIELLDALDEAMASASLCGLGQMAPLPYRSARTHFPDELRAP
ncbi:MAG TPA: NADH-ubiquinone oxidoreductase-F iron-sulfur binding region domain-containing protein [Dehalococcoidia bacterium]|nr:NADH-ubiquinone oxidoreductase-F iron-sulfur binding region domain-containing protein [Dehalococcoidia bacterium]